jgi:hypothetical protein
MNSEPVPKPLPEHLPHSRVSLVLMGVALLLSVGFVIYSASSNTPGGNDPGRGGALAVAISFGILFTRETSTENLFKDLAETRRKLSEKSPLPLDGEADPMVDDILRILTERSGGQTRQNIALAAVGVIGTLAWGFGDMAAVGMYPWFHDGKNYIPPAASVSGAVPSPSPLSGKASPTPR